MRTVDGAYPVSNDPVPIDQITGPVQQLQDETGPFRVMYVGNTNLYLLTGIRAGKIVYYYHPLDGYGEFSDRYAPRFVAFLPRKQNTRVDSKLLSFDEKPGRDNWVARYCFPILQAKSKIGEDLAIAENLTRARLEEERSKPRPVPQHQISGECGDALLQKIADHIHAAASVSDSELSSFHGPWTRTSISCRKSDIDLQGDLSSGGWVSFQVEKWGSADEAAKWAREYAHWNISAGSSSEGPAGIGENSRIWRYPGRVIVSASYNRYEIVIQHPRAGSTDDAQAKWMVSQVLAKMIAAE